jgi:hypothetical protein
VSVSKQRILEEIRRTAAENGGIAVGKARFESETGIKFHDWYGRYWARWGDAVREAGLQPNDMQVALSDADILPRLVVLIRELGRYPTSGELRVREHADPTFPTVFSRSAKRVWIAKLVQFCAVNVGHDDVAALLQAGTTPTLTEPAETNSDESLETGYVYLALMKVGREKRYKIGKADIVGRRTRQIAVELPEELELVHVISTDDAYGIEAYWHKRLASKRRGGEWFDLSSDEVKAFKRRKFM